MDSIGKINKICKSVLKLTDEDINSVYETVKEQSNYTHPLKGEKQVKFNELGDHNQKVLISIQNLRQILIDGEPR